MTELDYNIEWDEENDESVSANDGDLARKLVFPYDRNEPQLSDDQLMELDSIADGIELQRLTFMDVLLDSSCLEGVSYSFRPALNEAGEIKIFLLETWFFHGTWFLASVVSLTHNDMASSQKDL